MGSYPLSVKLPKVKIFCVDIGKMKKKLDKIIRISFKGKRNQMNGFLDEIENEPLIKDTEEKVTWANMTNVKNKDEK